MCQQCQYLESYLSNVVSYCHLAAKMQHVKWAENLEITNKCKTLKSYSRYGFAIASYPIEKKSRVQKKVGWVWMSSVLNSPGHLFLSFKDFINEFLLYLRFIWMEILNGVDENEPTLTRTTSELFLPKFKLLNKLMIVCYCHGNTLLPHIRAS